jgi:hypothetical protein
MEETTLSGRLPKQNTSVERGGFNKQSILKSFWGNGLKSNSVTLDIITFFFVTLLFYQAVYKLVDTQNYSKWLFYAPFIHKYWAKLTYIIPITQILLSGLLLIKRFRRKVFALLLMIFITYMVYLIIGQQKGYLVMQPYEVFWFFPKWNFMMMLNAIYGFIAYKGIISKAH